MLEEFDKTDLLGTQKLIADLLEKKEIEEFVLKYPGNVIEGLENRKDGFLTCFRFKEQKEMLRGCKLEILAVDTTYKICKYNYYLTVFFCLGQERKRNSVSFYYL